MRNIIKGIWLMLFSGFEDWQKERYKTCMGCTESPLCPACGCIIKAKVKVEKETCPKNKWQ